MAGLVAVGRRDGSLKGDWGLMERRQLRLVRYTVIGGLRWVGAFEVRSREPCEAGTLYASYKPQCMYAFPKS